MAKEPSKKELYDAAIKKDQESWSPGKKALEFAKDAVTDSPMYKMGKGMVDTSQSLRAAKAREQAPSDIADQLQTDRNERAYKNWEKSQGMKKGGKVCACGGGKMAKGGMARSSASKRADGIAIRGKTRA